MQMKKHKFALLTGLTIGTWMIPSLAFAEDCDTLDTNTEWQTGMGKVRNAYEIKDYSRVIEEAKPLFAICPRAPELNYYTGSALKKNGDTARALRYLQEAAKGTTEFDVNPVMSRTIWYTLYEAENPDRTANAVAEQNQKIEALIAQNEESKQVISDMKTNVATVELYSADKVKKTEAIVKSNYARTMWTGTGVGIAGLLVATAGILMVHYVNNNIDHGTSFTIKPIYNTGWAMLGGGIGLTIAGAIAAGIGGYQYTHATKSGDEISMSFGVSPTSAAFSMTF